MLLKSKRIRRGVGRVFTGPWVASLMARSLRLEEVLFLELGEWYVVCVCLVRYVDLRWGGGWGRHFYCTLLL